MREEVYINELDEEEEKEYQNCLELMGKGQREKAKQKLDEFLTENPGFIPALNKKAVIHIRQQEFNEAQSLLNQILERDSEYAPAITNLGSIANEMDNLSRAKELYQKAIEVDAEYGPAYNNLGVIFRQEGDYSKSIKYLKKARKRGSFSYEVDADKPLYKDPGCVFIIILIVALITIVYLIIT